MNIPLSEQAESVYLAFLGAQDALERVEEKLRAGKWPLEDYQRRKARLPGLEAGAETLRQLAEKERAA
jgi:hypothetical protein